MTVHVIGIVLVGPWPVCGTAERIACSTVHCQSSSCCCVLVSHAIPEVLHALGNDFLRLGLLISLGRSQQLPLETALLHFRLVPKNHRLALPLAALLLLSKIQISIFDVVRKPIAAGISPLVLVYSICIIAHLVKAAVEHHVEHATIDEEHAHEAKQEGRVPLRHDYVAIAWAEV
jgi:hypothetical protein